MVYLSVVTLVHVRKSIMSSILKDTRVSAGLTLQQVVNKAGIARATVERAEKGKQPISIVNAVRIVSAINALSGSNHTIESLDILTSD